MSTVRVETDSLGEIEVPARNWLAQHPLPAGGDGPAEVVNGRSAVDSREPAPPSCQMTASGRELRYVLVGQLAATSRRSGAPKPTLASTGLEVEQTVVSVANTRPKSPMQTFR
jgi:hypothetical protein